MKLFFEDSANDELQKNRPVDLSLQAKVVSNQQLTKYGHIGFNSICRISFDVDRGQFR